MAYTSGKNTRTFVLSMGPSVADPAGVVMCVETTDPDRPVVMSDCTLLKELIADLERKAIERGGASLMLLRICKMFGVKNLFQLEEKAGNKLPPLQEKT